MNVAKPHELLSVADYLAREDLAETRHEYVGGYVYPMAESRISHSRIAGAAFALLHQQLRDTPCESFGCNTKVRIRFSTHTRFYYPDVIVTCEPNSHDDVFQDRPTVIAEVLSDSTRRIDEWEKREAYLAIPSLMSYLLIETDQPRVVVHERTNEGFIIRAYQGLDAVIPLPAINATLSLADLYERSNFAAVE